MAEFLRRGERVRERQESGGRAEIVRELFEAENIKSRVIELKDGTLYRQAIIFSPESVKQDEPLVRVYRGINHLDKSILHQTSYALRTREGSGGYISELEHAREQVEALTDNPTHENLIRYVEAVWPDVADDEVERLESDLEAIEDDVLNGLPLRLALVHMTFGHNGGMYTDTGIAPYISASSDMNEAAGYGGKGIMVLDVPVSKIEALTGGSSREVAIKGAIPKEYISAILLKENPVGVSEEPADELALVSKVLSDEIPHEVIEGSAIDQQFSHLRAEEEAKDSLQHEKDVASIVERRSKLVLSKYPDSRPSEEEIGRLETGEHTDKYTATRRAIYDKLAERLEAAGRKKEDLEDFFVFDRQLDRETYTQKDVHYSRAEVTDKMLAKLRKLVVREEQYRASRKSALGE